MALLPRKVVSFLCSFVGGIAMIILPARRRLVLSNLYHAFPGKDLEWYKKICRINFSRLIELGTLAITIGFLRKKTIKSSFKLTQQYKKIAKEILRSERGAIILVPHFSLMEAMTALPMIMNVDEAPDIGVVYRPFENHSLEKFVKTTREKFGIKLISRKNGLRDVVHMLRRNGIIVFLFDQHAGDRGSRMLFFNRPVSATDLPNRLHEKFQTPVYFLYPRRLGFWRANVVIKRLELNEQDPNAVTIAANKYLENLLRSSDGMCGDWLWAHNRWKITTNQENDAPADEQNQIVKYENRIIDQDIPKTFIVSVRMPNWLGDVVMSIPVLRMLRSSRDDMFLILIAQRQHVEFLTALQIADRIIELPDKSFSYFKTFAKNRHLFPDVHISLVNSLRGDLEARMINSPVRIGMDTKNTWHRRFFINHLYSASSEVGSVHQTLLWQKMVKHFGFHGKENYLPFKFCVEMRAPMKHQSSIGIICGSANEPKKRWPTEAWKILIESLLESYPKIHINLYGSKADAMLTDEIALFFNRSVISNLAGKTTLLELSNCLQQDDLIIAIDSGGIHLANMFGRPVVGLYGITNPVATGPIFDSPVSIVMPTSAPMRGGFPTEDIEVDAVFKAAQKFLK